MTDTIHREALIRLPVVKQFAETFTTTIYDHQADDKACRAEQLGPRAVAWHVGEVLDWIAARPRVVVRGRAA